MTRAELAKMIDHTLLRPDATQREVAALCAEAIEHGFANVSVNPAWVQFCARSLVGSGVGIDATVGFPLGANTTYIKIEEARDAMQNGATELDMVINVGALKSGDYEYVADEIQSAVRIARNVNVKIILETGYLTDTQIRTVCDMSMRAGAAFVKTSTGFGPSGAKVPDVALMRSVVGDKMGVKAAGGIRSYTDAMAMIGAGANRLGTSAGVTILHYLPE